MKITVSQLRRIIKEEVAVALGEGFALPSRNEAEAALAVYLNYIQTHGYRDWMEVQEVTHEALDAVE